LFTAKTAIRVDTGLDAVDHLARPLAAGTVDDLEKIAAQLAAWSPGA
jgi:hypothetical protein